MAKLTTKARKALPKGVFGLPKANKGKGAYPMPNKSHARNAEARASEEEHKGKLSPAQEKTVDAKAKRVLGRGMVKKPK